MARINYLTRIEFGEGEIENLPNYLKELGISSPLIATDAGLVETGLVERVQELLDRSTIFDGTPANPTEAAVLEAFGIYKAHGCDGIIGLGGGSPIDLAKGVRILTGHDGPLVEFAAINGGVQKIENGMCRMIAIPTTSGTGSEVGRGSIINMEDGRKLGILSPFLLPDIALCDPQLTYGLPPRLTAATGMDALTHCMETYMAPAFNPPADGIALHGLECALRSIEVAVRDGSDARARQDMMVAALEGAMAFQKGLGAVHALTHPLGAIKSLNLHHGTLNAVLLPEVLRFNREAIGGKWKVLEKLVGDAPDRFVQALNERIGMPKGLKAMNVTEEMMEDVADNALLDHCHATNPRKATRDDYLRMLHNSA